MTTSNWIYGFAEITPGLDASDALESEVVRSHPQALEFRQRWEDLQLELAAGRTVPKGQVTTCARTLVDAAQADSVAMGRVDLNAAFQALCELPGGAGGFFRELLSSEPDVRVLKQLSAAFNGSFSFEADGRQSTATLHFQGDEDWPEALGGTWTSERMRSITVNCRYAKWRDRRVRRLTRVVVDAVDIIPKS